MDALKKYFKARLKENFPLANLTTLQIGGPAKAFLEVNSNDELIKAVQLAWEGKLPFLVIGGGSNLLIADFGVDYLVIKNSSQGIKKDRHIITVQAGTSLQDLVNFTIGAGLATLNKMTGIPGSVGGAVYGNAGAYGQTISDHLESVICVQDNKRLQLSRKECRFSYRDSGFKKNNLTILEVSFRLPKGNKTALEAEAKKILELRKIKYKPGLKCPGSFFRNFFTSEVPPPVLKMLPPREDTYGKTPAYIFLESLGAKGDRLGNIKIADHHANLFINLGEGKAEDFYNLASKWVRKVKSKFGVELTPEVQLINLPPLS